MPTVTLDPVVVRDAKPNALETPYSEVILMEKPISTSTDSSSTASDDSSPLLDVDVQEKLEASLHATEGSPKSITGPSRWHALLATWLGGVFDGMDSSIFAIVLYPSLSDLLNTTSHAVVAVHGSYIIALFMFGWAAGAIIFGTAADHFGRARVLTFTIILYALCTGLCATAHSWQELGFYRFLVGAGIGGEMGIDGVHLSECWTSKTREHAVGAMATSLGFG